MYPNMNNNENENVLERYGRDITESAKANKIDPVIGLPLPPKCWD